MKREDNDELTAAYLAGCYDTRKVYEQRLAEAEARIDAGEALLNRMSMNLMLSGYSHEGDKNNPMNDWLARVVEWKKARLECPVKEGSGRGSDG